MFAEPMMEWKGITKSLEVTKGNALHEENTINVRAKCPVIGIFLSEPMFPESHAASVPKHKENVERTTYSCFSIRAAHIYCWDAGVTSA